MKHRFLTEAGLAVLTVGALVSFFQEHEGHAHDDSEAHAAEHAEEVAPPADPHFLAPQDISLEMTQADLLRAPGEDWFAAQAEAHPERFSYDGESWVDATGEYVRLYDEDEDEYAYWQNLSAARLTRGRQDFIQFCASCHGFEGDGNGRSGQHLRPPPRSFHQSNFKFTKVLATLPTDEALMELIQKGLTGTPMYPWALSEEQLMDIIQYIKTLSPPDSGWRDVFVEIGGKVDVGEDTWSGRESKARARGEEIYHGLAGCHACHPGYVTETRLAEIRGDAEGTKYREDLSYPALKESNYMVGEKQIYFLPPDFTWHQLRAGISHLELAETIASGIKGTAMPQWKGSVPDEDIWAMAYYVRGLIDDYKDQPEKRAAFMAGLRGQ